jgi:hypothetical protein
VRAVRGELGEECVGVLDADPQPGARPPWAPWHNMMDLRSRDTAIMLPASHSNEKPSVSM